LKAELQKGEARLQRVALEKPVAALPDIIPGLVERYRNLVAATSNSGEENYGTR